MNAGHVRAHDVRERRTDALPSVRDVRERTGTHLDVGRRDGWDSPWSVAPHALLIDNVPNVER